MPFLTARNMLTVMAAFSGADQAGFVPGKARLRAFGFSVFVTIY